MPTMLSLIAGWKNPIPFPPFFYAKLHLMRSEKTLDFSLQRVVYLCFVSKPITQSIHDTEREVMCYLFNQKLPHPMLLPLSWMLPPKEKKWSNVPCTDHLLQHQSFQGIFFISKVNCLESCLFSWQKLQGIYWFSPRELWSKSGTNSTVSLTFQLFFKIFQH